MVRHLPHCGPRTLLVAFALMMAGACALAAPLVEPAGAQAPASSSSASGQLFGLVFPDEGGALATKVRAVGASRGGVEVVCGTAEVRRGETGAGTYRLEVVSGEVRAGCPRAGETVDLVLLYGAIDEGEPAHALNSAVFVPGEVVAVSLAPRGAASDEGWQGTPPPPGRTSLMVWQGPEARPAAEAVALIDADVASVHWYDGERRAFVSFVPDGPAFAQTYTTARPGDVLLVRAR